MGDKPFYKSWSFWLLFITAILATLFVFLGKPFYEDFTQRAIYGGGAFVSILILNLLYLLFSKEENRARREKKISNFWKSRKDKKAQKEEEQKLVINLREKFNNAKKVIKDASIYESISYQNYELPWYLVIGEEQSQKASIIRGSGLDFPLNINYKDGEYSENQDDMSSFRWFFAEEGVFINIPSSYVSVDKDRLEKIVWNEFLRLFKKERWRRPVNGIILTLNVQKFYNDNRVDLKEYAKVLRARFDEVSKAFFSDIPIYVVISGLESIKGFYEFFNRITDEEKREILGITFDERLSNIGRDDIDAKFNTLLKRVENDKIDRLYQEYSVDNRAKAYFFDKNFKELLYDITDFTAQVFSKTRYHAPLMLRGIYFTTIDSNSSRGMFLPKVFEQIILSESDLVKIDEKYKKRYGILQWLWITILSLIVVGAGYYWLNFLTKESSEVPKIESNLKEYRELMKTINDPLTVEKREIPKSKKSYKLGQLGGGSGNNSVNFKVGKSELTLSAKEQLLKVLNKIRALDSKTRVKIIGHTDDRGRAEKNQALSQERAESVKEYFVSLGVDAQKIITLGKGESKPIADNNTKEGRELNRRVEILADSTMDEELEESPNIEKTNQEWSPVIKVLNLLCLAENNCSRDISSDFWKPAYYRVAQRDELTKELYYKTLNLILLQRVANLIERELLDNLDNRAITTYNLKAYLLLKDKKRREKNPNILKEYMLDRWGEIEPKDKAILNRHFERLLSIEMADIKLNETSIKKARSAILANSSEVNFYYNQMQTITSQKQLNSFRFKDEVLRSTEIDDGGYEVAGIYTRDGYRSVIVKSSRLILKSVIKDNWILGKSEEYSTLAFEKLYKKVLRLYFSDYRKEWDMALSKISIIKRGDSDELAEQLDNFSSTESPVIEIIRALKKNTYLYTTAERTKKEMSESPIAGKIASKVDSLIVKKDIDEKYKLNMRAYYKEYYKLLTKDGQPASKLKTINKKLKRVYQEILSADNPTGSIDTKLKKDLNIKFQKLPIIVGNWYKAVLNRNWKELNRGVQIHLKKEYKEVYQEYSKKIANKFPLNPKASKEIDINDFVEFFKKDGVWDSYYKKYEDEVKHNSSLSMSQRVKSTMERIEKIRDLLFNGGNSGLEISFDIEPLTLDSNFLGMELEYKGQTLTYNEETQKGVKRFTITENDNPLSAKFELKDFDSTSIVKIEGTGRWALLRLLYKLHPHKIRGGVVTLSSSGNSLIVKGKSVNLLSTPNILQKFRLQKP